MEVAYLHIKNIVQLNRVFWAVGESKAIKKCNNIGIKDFFQTLVTLLTFKEEIYML